MRDGIAGGLEIVLPQSIHVNVPIKERFALISPNVIDFDPDEGFVLRHFNNVFPIAVMPSPSFAGQLTESVSTAE
jgi:hypothetical protein